MPREYRLQQAQLLPTPRDDVWRFFTDVANLERLTPDFLRFKILSPLPIPFAAGAQIDYRLRLWGVPFRWRTRIEAVEPGRWFSDVQERGPYRFWHHRHEFYDVPEGTLMIDSVRYALPWGPLGRLAHGLFVRESLAQIFDFRRAQVTALFGPAPLDASRTEPAAR